jgi:WD40 repeat protein
MVVATLFSLKRTVFLQILLLFLIVGCAGTPGRPADVIIHDAHGSGSVLAVDYRSEILASGDKGGQLRLWRLDTGAAVAGWWAHRGTLNGIHFLPDSRRLLTAAYDGRISEWDLSGRLIRSWETGSPVSHMVADSNSDFILTGHKDGSVKLWRLVSGELAGVWQAHRKNVFAVALDAKRGRIAASGPDGALAYGSIGSPGVRYLASSRGKSKTLAFSPKGDQLYGAGWGTLLRWSLQSGEVQEMDTEHGGRISRIHFLPDGRRLASISRLTDSAVLILDAETGKTLQRLQKHDLCGDAVTVSPNGRFLASNSDDASVRIWDLWNRKSHGKSVD